ncbi:MAG: alpha/beta hydrolase-fold protein, partial [Phycisphaerales bacterium]
MITIPIRGAFALVLSLLVTVGVASPAQAQTVFRVTLAPGVLGDAPVVAGRLVVALAHEDANISRRTSPLDAPFWDDPQPIFGTTVSMKPGEAVIVDDAATSFASKPSALKPGRYRAAAWLVANQATSKWRGVPGNAYSEVVEFVVPEPPGVGGPVDITLATATREPERRWRPGQVEEFVVRGALLSAFHGREVVLRAGVVLPAGGVQEGRRYPAVYHVPGFGGRHDEALSVRRAVARGDGDLDRNVLHIYLDPESPNGHTLFADSANNGPWNRALVEELIPALEKQYPLISEPTARVLRGHSSGGWSVVWLGVNNPQTFGFAWSTAPDPVCFSWFQLVDIYRRANMFVPAPGEPVGPGDAAGADTPSYRRGGAMKMTIRQEAGGEEVLGPDATCGQQWASWQAVVGPRDERGRSV